MTIADQVDFVRIINEILDRPTENWSLSSDFFHEFYKKYIKGNQKGWQKKNVELVLYTLKSQKKDSGKTLTESLIETLKGNSGAISIINQMVELIKICDKQAYKQDNKKPFVARTFVRQNMFYDMILNWKLEKRKETIFDDIINSKSLKSIIKNVFLFLNEPPKFISSVSPKHRGQFINAFIDNQYELYNYEGYQKACLESNEIILEFFRKQLSQDPELSERLESAPINEHFFSRVITKGMYHVEVNPLWHKSKKPKEKTDGKSYWQIAPGEQARLWDDLLNDSIAAVGYNVFDFDIKDKSKDELLDLFKKSLPDLTEMSAKINITQLWHFLNLKPGDKIVVNKGRSLLLGLGVLKSGYKFRPERKEYQHTIDVEYYKVSETGIPIPERIKGKFGKTITPLNKEEFETLEALFLPVKKRSWIFQANPKYYDLEGSLKVLKEHRWSLNQHKEKIHAGDTVYLWQSGLNAGIYAIGTVMTEPKEMHEDERELPFVKSTEKFQTLEVRSIVKVKRVLQKPILRENLLRNSSLSNLPILKQPAGTNFPVSQEQSDLLMKLIDEEVIIFEKYTKEDALKGLFIDEEEFDYILNRLKSKKNIILQGPPGVGKTFIAKRVAFCLMGFKDETRASMIQFHQSYSYEDFIQGFRPNDEGKFDLKNGIFYQFCRSAMEDDDSKYVFIIDEINRGNLSKIFGEMLMLIESDKRGPDFSVPLTYGKDYKDRFYIPSNVHIIGTMNTADRSLAMVDYALRRRFSFINLKPRFTSPKFTQFLKSFDIDDELISKIVDRMTGLNEKIAEDAKNLGAGYQLGHSYLCPDNTEDTYDDNWYRTVIKSEIEPLLTEYWFDDPERVKKHISNLLS